MNKHYRYATRGTCSKAIDFEIEDDGTIKNVQFFGGCDGNLKAIGRLVEGQNAQQIMNTLKGNRCGRKPTSCADQLAVAIHDAINGELKPVD